MAAGVACGLQNRRGARTASRVGSTPTRSRHFARIAVTLLVGLLSGVSGVGAQEPEALDTVAAPLDLPTDRFAGGELSGEPPTSAAQVARPVSPMGAFLRSLVIPGWGQVAVEQPTRGAFYFAMEAGTLWMLFATHARVEAAERAGNESLVETRKDQREDWLVLAVFWGLLSGVDAWVSAHMWDFEGAIVPPPDGSPGVAVQYSVPVGGP